MSTKHLFGRSISLTFRPAADDEDVTAYALVSARIYGPNPSLTDAQIENTASGHIGSEITSWTPTGVGEYTIAIPALVDASPHSAQDFELYKVVFNYTPQSGGATQFDVETIFVYRPDSATTKIDVTKEAVFRLESRIKTLAPSISWVEDKILVAIDEIIAKLEARGYKKRLLFNLQKLNPTVARKATALCCGDLAAQGSQFWATKEEKWEKSCDEMFESAVIGFDTSGADSPTPDMIRETGAVMVMR